MSEQLTTIPTVLIEIKGKPLDPSVVLVSARIQQRISLPTACELLFSTTDNLLIDEKLFFPENELKVRIDGFDESLFMGQITAIEYIHSPSNEQFIKVRGYDKLESFRKQQSVKIYPQTTLGELFNELAQSLSIAVNIVADSGLYEQIVQFEQTHFELLQEFAQKNGLYFSMREGTWNLFTLEGFGDVVDLEIGNNLFESKLQINTNKKYQSVKTTGWNTSRVEMFHGETAKARAVGGLEEKLENNNFKGKFQKIINDETLTDEFEARALSQSELDRQSGKEMTFWGVAKGNPKLQSGTPINLKGHNSKLNGKYVITSVNHIIDYEKGFISEVSTTPPEPLKREKSAFATIGIMTNINDSEGFGRGRAKLPNYNNIETDWMQISTPGAGIGKGLVALPDVDDTVLILFPRGDITQGIIIGGLYGMMKTEDWDWGIQDGRVKGYKLQTSGNQTVTLNDETETLKIENSDGSFVQMSPNKFVLHSNQKLEIRAPEQEIVIKGKTIDFEKG